MPTTPVQLRIYCICGQKMRVNPSMLGRPGKCIACRQKIRIPRADEIPARASEIFLKDHPEFLRNGNAGRTPDDFDGTVPSDDVALGNEGDDVESVAIDILPPLRELCSFEHKILQRLEVLRPASREGAEARERADLIRYRAMVRQAKAALEESLRQRLMDVAQQLGAAKDKLNRAAAAVRVGEMSYGEYQKSATALRHQRERLERRRQNLRGWLAVSDPHMAGGYLDLKLEDVPIAPSEVGFQGEPISDDRTLADFLVGQLHDALSRIEATEGRIGKWARAEGEQQPADDEKSAILAEKERAQAAARFYRKRLERLAQDCESDIKAVKAHLEFARNRFEAGELAKGDYQDLEMELLRAQADNAKARDLARRAGTASVLSDLPRASASFLERFGKPPVRQVIGADSWMIWMAALLLVAVMFLPVSAAQGSNAENARGLTIAVVIIAALFSIFGALPQRALRGILINLVWAVGTIGLALYLSDQYHSIRAVGMAMRSDAVWYLRPGMLALMASGLLAGAASVSSLFPYRLLRIPVVLLAAGVFACVVAIATDFGGYFRPVPAVDVQSAPMTDNLERYETVVTVRNDGLRNLWLADSGSTLPNAFTYLLELRIGRDSWRDITVPDRLIADRQQFSRADLNGMPPMMLAPGGEARFVYFLAPGIYRAQVRQSGQKPPNEIREFELAIRPDAEVDLNPSEETGADPDARTDNADGSAMNERTDGDERDESSDEGSEVPAPPGSTIGRTVELRGVMNGPDAAPLFALIVYQRDGTQDSVRIRLGDRLYSEWTATEFNPETQALTVSNGEEIVILRRGEPVLLAPSIE